MPDDSITNMNQFVKSFRSKKRARALSSTKDEVRTTLSYPELYDAVESCARGLYRLGLEPGDKIASIAKNSPETVILSLAAQAFGFVIVPRTEEASSEDLESVIRHSESRLVIVDHQQTYDKIKGHDHHSVSRVLSVSDVHGIDNFSVIMEKGRQSNRPLPNNIPEDALMAIDYTSGSTARPKGVMISHKNRLSNMRAVEQVIPIGPEDRFLGFLPISHPYGEISMLVPLDQGAEVVCSDKRSILKDMSSERPTFIASVPELWEKAYRAIMIKFRAEIQEKGLAKRYLAEPMLNLAIEYHKMGSMDPRRPIAKLAHDILEKEHFFDKIKDHFGGRLKYIVSGGAALPTHIEDFFEAAGMEILVGYGMTEASPIITGRKPGVKARYTAGQLLPGVEALVLDPRNGEELPQGVDGLLYFAGDNVMLGYWNDYQATHEALVKMRGRTFLNTGDKGHFDKDRNLVITGRYKNTIVSLGGEKFEPETLEDELRNSEYIQMAMVVGQDWKKPGAFLVVNEANLRQLCELKGWSYDQLMVDPNNSPELRSIFKAEIYQYVNNSSKFPRYQHIAAFRIVRPFSRDTVGEEEEMTHTNKMRRHVLAEHLKYEIEDMKREVNKTK